ncbi:MAG: hypothetical protein K0R21_261 [Anaerocolumna sp.]|nr:hypothetical protein [Anaerocolumna sp.]
MIRPWKFTSRYRQHFDLFLFLAKNLAGKLIPGEKSLADPMIGPVYILLPIMQIYLCCPTGYLKRDGGRHKQHEHRLIMDSACHVLGTCFPHIISDFLYCIYNQRSFYIYTKQQKYCKTIPDQGKFIKEIKT